MFNIMYVHVVFQSLWVFGSFVRIKRFLEEEVNDKETHCAFSVYVIFLSTVFPRPGHHCEKNKRPDSHLHDLKPYHIHKTTNMCKIAVSLYS